MKRTISTTMKRILIIGLAVFACGVLTSQAANMPQYQFYSTSMLSPNKQSNYAPSHINQSGSVKVQLNANKRVPVYELGRAGVNYRVFSAEAFTKPAKGNNGSFVIVGNYIAGDSYGNTSSRSNGASLNSSFSNGISSLKLYTLATSGQSLNSTRPAQDLDATSTKAARVQRRTWMNIDEVERMEAMDSYYADSLYAVRAMTLLESMSSVQGVLADESLVTADRRRVPGTPGSTGEELPIGDAVWPLMLLAMAYVVIKRGRLSLVVSRWRRRKTDKKTD